MSILSRLLGMESHSFGHMDPDALQSRLDRNEPVALLDVRTPEEFAEGHIPGAINIPVQALAARCTELAARRAEPWIVCCRSGARAAQACRILADAGFGQISLLRGHMLQWVAQGRSISRKNKPFRSVQTAAGWLG